MNNPYDIALYAHQIGDSQKAVSILTEHLQDAPEDVHALVLLASLRYEMGKKELARKTLDKAFELQPDSAGAWAEKGKWLLNEQQWRDAEVSLSQSLIFEPNNPISLLHRGVVRRRMEKWDLARGDFEQALAMDPEQQEAAWHLRVLDEKEGAHADGSWVTIATHFDPDWMYQLVTSLLELGIPTKISEQDAILNLDASTDHPRKLQVQVEHAEQAFWHIEELFQEKYPISPSEDEFLEDDSEEDIEPSPIVTFTRRIMIMATIILVLVFIGLFLVNLWKG